MSLRQTRLSEFCFQQVRQNTRIMNTETKGSSYDEAIDIETLQLKNRVLDDTSITESMSLLSSNGYCDFASEDDEAIEKKKTHTPDHQMNVKDHVFWYSHMNTADNTTEGDQEPKKENKGVTYNVRDIDKDLQNGMADAELRNKERHRYAPKARNTLKTTRKPSPEYEVKVAPPHQRSRLPYGTEPKKFDVPGAKIDLNDYEITSPVPVKITSPWPFLTQRSIQSPDDMQYTSRSMDEKKTHPKRKKWNQG